MSDTLQPSWTVACQAPLGDSPGKNTRVGCHFLLQFEPIEVDTVVIMGLSFIAFLCEILYLQDAMLSYLDFSFVLLKYILP